MLFSKEKSKIQFIEETFNSEKDLDVKTAEKIIYKILNK
jgi:hypothetical protein